MRELLIHIYIHAYIPYIHTYIAYIHTYMLQIGSFFMEYAQVAQMAAIRRSLLGGLMYAFSQYVMYLAYFVAFQAAG